MVADWGRHSGMRIAGAMSAEQIHKITHNFEMTVYISRTIFIYMTIYIMAREYSVCNHASNTQLDHSKTTDQVLQVATD